MIQAIKKLFTFWKKKEDESGLIHIDYLESTSFKEEHQLRIKDLVSKYLYMMCIELKFYYELTEEEFESMVQSNEIKYNTYILYRHNND